MLRSTAPVSWFSVVAVEECDIQRCSQARLPSAPTINLLARERRVMTIMDAQDRIRALAVGCAVVLRRAFAAMGLWTPTSNAYVESQAAAFGDGC